MIPRKDLLTLNEEQGDMIRKAMQNVEDAQVFLNALLKIVQPDGATGFEKSTMTFYTEPPVEPKE